MKYYRANSISKIRKYAREYSLVEEGMFSVEAEPSYLFFSRIAFLAGTAYERIVNSSDLFTPFRSVLCWCFRREGSGTGEL